jgi:hypothetical protein
MKSLRLPGMCGISWSLGALGAMLRFGHRVENASSGWKGAGIVQYNESMRRGEGRDGDGWKQNLLTPHRVASREYHSFP